MEKKNITQDISQLTLLCPLDNKLPPKKSSPQRGLKILREKAMKKKEGNPKKQLDGKAKGLWDAARTRKNLIENEKSIVKVAQYANEKFEGFFQNYAPVTVILSEANWRSKYETLDDSPFQKKFIDILEGNDTLHSGLKKDKNEEMSNILASLVKLDEKLFEEFLCKISNEEFQKVLELRKKLPVWSQKEDIVKAIKDNQVVVISGATGCGKTTQICQFLLDQAIESRSGSTFCALCTQPRRLAAISAAHRVAEERVEVCGDPRSSVGYQIRLERLNPRERGSILFCTTGILVQLLISDPLLEKYSHILLDEVHERDLLTDFILTVVRDLLPKRPKLRVILMSATINSNLLSEYFNNCPVLNIAGRSFPVETVYLEDILSKLDFRFRSTRNRSGADSHPNHLDIEYNQIMAPFVEEMEANHSYPFHVLKSLRKRESEESPEMLIMALLKHICAREADGAILIFFPGWEQIKRLNKLLLSDRTFSSRKFLIFTLHSMLPTFNQRQIFEKPPRGVRKLILSTNIAETSLTIDDIVYVIDCGKAKLPNFDPLKKLNTLNSEWIALANAHQRQGRAGRTKPGICYKLYSRGRESTFVPHALPEIKRTRLEELILRVKILKLGQVQAFLRKVPEPPDDLTVKISLELLHELGALDDAECLTPLGFHLAQLPTDPSTGKLILLGAIFGCLEPMLAIAATLSFKDPFVMPLNQEDNYRKRRKFLAEKLFSDHLLIAKVMHDFRAAQLDGHVAAKNYCHENFLSTSTMTMLSNMMEQFCRDLRERQFLSNSASISDPVANINSKNHPLILAVLCAGLLPNVAEVVIAGRSLPKRNLPKIPTSSVKVKTPEDGPVLIHPRSINYDTVFAKSTWLCYHGKVKSSNSIYLQDCSIVPPLAVLFFGDEKLFNKKDAKLSKRFGYKWDSSTMEATRSLRTCWDNYLCHRVSHPGATDWSSDSTDSALLRAIIHFTTATAVSLNEDTGLLSVAHEEANNSRRSMW